MSEMFPIFTTNRQCEVCECFLTNDETDRCEDCTEFNGACGECGEVLEYDGSCSWCCGEMDIEPDVDEAQEWYDFDPDC